MLLNRVYEAAADVVGPDEEPPRLELSVPAILDEAAAAAVDEVEEEHRDEEPHLEPSVNIRVSLKSVRVFMVRRNGAYGI